MANTKLQILIPVYNDWQCLRILINEITDKVKNNSIESINFVVVNDKSNQLADTDVDNQNIEIINLNRNVGHQKAISIGMSYIAENKDFDAIVVMDSDGEDKPEDIVRLIEKYDEDRSKIVFATRKTRQEGSLFKIFYKLYKFSYYILTGKKISFGNFCIIPKVCLKNLVQFPEISNHFAAAVIKSKIPFVRIPTNRGKRYVGKSRMTLVSLVLHGLNAITVQIDTVAVRLLIVTLLLVILAVAGIVTVISIKLFTIYTVPGWASFIVLGLSLMLFQFFMISLFLTFIVLTYRTQRFFIPAIDYKMFIDNIEGR